MSFEDTNFYLRWFGMMIIKPALLENLLPLSLLSLGFSTAAAASVYLKRILWTSNIGRWPSLISKFMSLVFHQPIWLWQSLNVELWILHNICFDIFKILFYNHPKQRKTPVLVWWSFQIISNKVLVSSNDMFELGLKSLLK